MSYLDPPRFHFSGIFTATPSTINNATENYSLTAVYNTDQNDQPGPSNPNSVFWFPDGTAFFTLPQVSVMSAVGLSGPAGSDPIVGASITEVAWGGPPAQLARVADLDPDMQMRTLIVGLQIAVTLPGASSPALTGTMRPANIIDFWNRSAAGACIYMSVLENLTWGDISTSPFLQELQTTSGSMLSIKFNLDLYNANAADTADVFQQGRIAGTIGPYSDGEGVHVLNQRRMWIGSPLVGTDIGTPLFNAPFKISGTTLRLDLGNSIPTVSVSQQSHFQSLGAVGIVIDPQGADIYTVVYSTADEYMTQYTNAAGIFDVELGDSAAAAANAPLAVTYDPAFVPTAAFAEGSTLIRMKSGIRPPLALEETHGLIALAENPDGMFAAMDYVALRLQNGAPSWADTPDANDAAEVTADAEVPVYCTQFGQPASATIDISITPTQYQWASPSGENPWIIDNTPPPPTTAITFDQSVQTVNGVATAHFTAGPLSAAQKEPRRASIDGEIFTFTFTSTMDPVSPASPGTIPLTLLVFEDSPVVESPTWTNDIQPIFEQYARLYPYMTQNVVDLSNYQAVVQNAARIQAAINRPRNDPSFMPVTRDLSVRRLNMLNSWFANRTPP